MPETTAKERPRASSYEIDPERKVRRSWQSWLSGSPVLLISILLHILFAILAAFLFVQHVQQKRKQNFTEISIDHTAPATAAAKHQEQVTEMKNAMTTPDVIPRLTVESLNPVALPDVSLPSDSTSPGGGKMEGTAVGGIGNGIGVGAGTGVGIDIASIAKTAFGISDGKGLGLVGHFYDLKQTAGRAPTGMNNRLFCQVIADFMHTGWRRNFFEKYFIGPKPLYAPQIFIPYISADDGPKAFNLQDLVQPKQWVVLYHGKFQVGHSGTYRFVGSGDDLMEVAFNHQTVLDASWRGADGDHSCGLPEAIAFAPTDTYHYTFPVDLRNSRFTRNKGQTTMPFPCGTWISLDEDTVYDLDILVGEHPGGACGFWLLVEEKGQTYRKSESGDPLLPPFKVSDATLPPARTNTPPVDRTMDLGWHLIENEDSVDDK